MYLEEVSQWINDEYGEYLYRLSEISRYDYCMSEEMKDALKKEIESQIEYLEGKYKFHNFKTERVVVYEGRELVCVDFDDEEEYDV